MSILSLIPKLAGKFDSTVGKTRTEPSAPPPGNLPSLSSWLEKVIASSKLNVLVTLIDTKPKENN